MAIQVSKNIDPLDQREAMEAWRVTHGMTQRDHFAVLAMQGLISHYGYGEAPVADAQEIARWAVHLADALIQELHPS